ncbi:hypothetical protein LTR95_003014 [Oleoguttula sp. CCFEE 5521]
MNHVQRSTALVALPGISVTVTISNCSFGDNAGDVGSVVVGHTTTQRQVRRRPSHANGGQHGSQGETLPIHKTMSNGETLPNGEKLPDGGTLPDGETAPSDEAVPTDGTLADGETTPNGV